MLTSELCDDSPSTCRPQLTHNVHGPHDEKFYAFLKKLNVEYDELQAKGYTGMSIEFGILLLGTTCSTFVQIAPVY